MKIQLIVYINISLNKHTLFLLCPIEGGVSFSERLDILGVKRLPH